MVVMEVPRIEQAASRNEPWSDAYVAPVGGQYRRTPDEEDDLRALEELFWTLDLGPRHRVELLDGRIEVSPKPAHWHERAVMWLIRGFDTVCHKTGWDPTPGADLPLPPDGDIIEPDYIIARDPDAIPDERSVVPHDQTLLVAEICSPSSIRQDREVKPLKCARAGIPLYLLVDRFTQPMTITLMSEPGEQGYRRIETVHAGPDGGTLVVPAPFDITIDASTLPEFRSAASKREGQPVEGISPEQQDF
jgi:Uma2 family endonuclease